MTGLRALVLGLGLILAGPARAEPWLDRAPGALRVATPHAAPARTGSGLLVHLMTRGGGHIAASAQLPPVARPRDPPRTPRAYASRPHSAAARSWETAAKPCRQTTSTAQTSPTTEARSYPV